MVYFYGMMLAMNWCVVGADMTDDELKQLVAGLAVAQVKTDEQLRQTDEQLKKTDEQLMKTDEQLRQTDEQLKKTDEQLKKTDEKLGRIGLHLGNVTHNQGDVAEDFFYNSLLKDNYLGGLKFDDISKSMFKHRGKIQEEYDIFLTNGESIAIIEVKYKAHIEDIKKLERKFNNFKKLYPIYSGYKLYGAMASFYFNLETKDELLKQGYFVLERCGDLIKSNNGKNLKVA